MVAARGHSKDHRPDLKQLALTLTVAADGAVPIAHRLLDGNTTDDRTHIETWEGLRELTGRADFLYVADSKLATHEQMTHISARGGRFVSVLPRSRAEDAQIREWAQTHAFDWTEAARKPGRRKGDPDDVWSVAPAPIPTAEGYRIVWVRSSQKAERDAESRRDRLERGISALEEIQARLRGPRSRLRKRVAVEQAAKDALARAGAERWGSAAPVSQRPRSTARPTPSSSRRPSRKRSSTASTATRTGCTSTPSSRSARGWSARSRTACAHTGSPPACPARRGRWRTIQHHRAQRPFTGVVYPGEALTVELWRTGPERAHGRVSVGGAPERRSRPLGNLDNGRDGSTTGH